MIVALTAGQELVVVIVLLLVTIVLLQTAVEQLRGRDDDAVERRARARLLREIERLDRSDEQ